MLGSEPDLERQVDIRFAPAEPRRHHADDLIVLAHELNGAPDDRRIAGVVALPELVAEHDDALRLLPRRRVRRDQPAPQHRRRAPVIRRVRGDVRGDDVFRDIAVGGREVPAVLADDAFDRARLPQLIELRAAHPRIPEAAGRVPERELHHPLGADVGKRIDQHAVDDAEDGARGADPEGEREDRREREARPAAELARGVAKISDDRVHAMAWTGISDRWLADDGSACKGRRQKAETSG